MRFLRERRRPWTLFRHRSWVLLRRRGPVWPICTLRLPISAFKEPGGKGSSWCQRGLIFCFQNAKKRGDADAEPSADELHGRENENNGATCGAAGPSWQHIQLARPCLACLVGVLLCLAVLSTSHCSHPKHTQAGGSCCDCLAPISEEQR